LADTSHGDASLAARGAAYTRPAFAYLFQRR
jgi:hypothetical protein